MAAAQDSSGASPHLQPGEFFARLVEDRPDIAVCKASLLAVRAAEDAAAEHGITLAQHMVLQMLDTVGASSQQALAEELRIDRTTMVRCIDTLEQAGHVERQRDPTDRRAYAVHLTDSGRALLTEANSGVPATLKQTFAVLDETERADLTRLLVKLVTNTAL